MQQLVELINSLNHSDANPEKVLKLFADRMRRQYGACATALVCTEGLQPRECRIMALFDHKGNTLIENIDLPLEQDSSKIYHDDFLTEILSKKKPVVFRGKQYGIHQVFNPVFDSYIDAISLPIIQPDNIYRWLLILFTEPDKVDDVDLERSLLISTLASNYVNSVINARKLQEAKNWIQQEIESVARIQQLLLPPTTAETPGIKIASHFVPHAFVGGDYYDYVNLSDIFGLKQSPEDYDTWGFMIADASGHGAAAAVEIAMYDAILRTYNADTEAGPGGVFTYTNKHFFTRMVRGNFITAFVSSYIPQQHAIIYANAGHPPPIIKTAAGKLSYLDQAHGIPLGILPDNSWDNGRHEMYKGDMLVLFTDGIIEATSPEGEMFGQHRLEKLLLDNHGSPDQLVEHIKLALQTHQQNEPQRDDQTLMIIEILQ